MIERDIALMEVDIPETRSIALLMVLVKCAWCLERTRGHSQQPSQP